MPHRLAPLAACLTLLWTAIALGQCEPGWAPGPGERAFGYPGARDGGFACAVEFDDGRGAALYLAGGFTQAGSADAMNIVRWDGLAWEPLGEGLDGSVAALAVYDDGTGPSLYAGGSFVRAGGQVVRSIARWDGAQWHALDGGVSGQVRSMAVFDPGDGPKLYVGGRFTTVGPGGALVTVDHLAQWDGDAWSPVADATFGGFGVGGSAFDLAVNTLAVYDDGSGASLFVGGTFAIAGGRGASRVARWDGRNWFDLGAGLTGSTPGTTYASSMAVHDDGDGPDLYVGGRFLEAGGVRVNHIARWDGAAWSALGTGVSAGAGSVPDVLALGSFQGPDGPELLVGGGFDRAGGATSRRLARWTDRWALLPQRLDDARDVVLGFVPTTVGGPERLVVAGGFDRIDRSSLGGVMAWDGASFSSLDGGFYARFVSGLTAVRLDSGPTIFGVAGFGGGSTEPKILVRWDGRAWIDLGAELTGVAHAMAWFDDGTGPALYVAGNILAFGRQDLGHIAKWDGSQWRGLGGGFDREAYALAVYDDGAGPALYAGGVFVSAGSVAAERIARWDGTDWSPLGTGLGGAPIAMEVADLGDGPALYAGGSFSTAGGAPASMIARWDGSSWSPLGGGIGGTAIGDLQWATLPAVGPVLVAAGNFSTAGGAPASRVASWDGSSWSPMGAGTTGFSFELAAYDDGRGEAIYLGGDFNSVDGVAARNIARWDGIGWEALGAGLNGSVAWMDAIDDDGAGGAAGVYVAGSFSEAGGRTVPSVARWRCQVPGCPADLDGDGELTIFDFLVFGSLFDRGDPAADFDGDGALTLFDFLAFQSAFDAGCP
ncbi:MAG: GC-type dockerin domain-anchored protein [Phycisphaerales bacterium JB060]